MPFLPIEPAELKGKTPDIVFVTGEAYCDHPSFGQAILTRLIESEGLTVALLCQPQCDADFLKFGAPRHAFFVSGGVVDSMVNNYTVAKRRRDRDIYSEGGVPGRRPDRAVTVYSRTLKRLFPDVPVMIGGMEASLRRFAHYDYWSDSVMPSILMDSGADLLCYGMGERPVRELCAYFKKGVPMTRLKDIRGTCYMSDYDGLSASVKAKIERGECTFVPTLDEVRSDKLSYVRAFNLEQENNDHAKGRLTLQKHGDKYLVQNPPQLPMSVKEMDEIYALPYMRTYHPSYQKGVPAMEEVKFSITSHRGCYGSCNYCAITYHQGRLIQKRSKESIVKEAEGFVQDKDFKGYIHDVGGPTANFRNPACSKQLKGGFCKNKSCIGYEKCNNLEVSHEEYVDLLRTLRELDGVKKVFVRSGIRYDYVMYDKDDTFFRELVEHHVSGQLKVAPEHVSKNTLRAMNKPNFELYKAFKAKFERITAELGKKQYLVPYLISSHPGCTLDDAINLAEYLDSIHYMPEQVQDFYPTPSTKSTCMYYTGINPDTMEEVYVARSPHEKAMQRALMQYRKPSNAGAVKEALTLTGRLDSRLKAYAGPIHAKSGKTSGANQRNNGRKKSPIPTYNPRKKR